jgi:hypothetical protein
LTVSKKQNDIYIELTRENNKTSNSLNEPLEVLIKSIKTDQVYLNDYKAHYINKDALSLINLNQSNLSIARAYQDYQPLNIIVKLLPGQVSKKIYLNNTILRGSGEYSDSNSMKMFTIHIKPLLGNSTLGQCHFVNPDYVNIVIQEEKVYKSNRSKFLIIFSTLIDNLFFLRRGCWF